MCLCVCVHACTHSRLPASVPYRFSHSRLAEKTEKSPELYLNSHITKNLFISGTCEGEVGLVALFPQKKIPSQLNKNAQYVCRSNTIPVLLVGLE